MKNIMKLSILVIAFALTLISCSNNSSNPVTTVSITGHWVGSQNYNNLITFKLDINLTDVSGVIGGSGKLTYTPILMTPTNVDIPVIAGTFSNPNVNLTLSGITFTGTLSNDQKSIVGTANIPKAITGSTDIALNMTLVKQ